jgi:hypothetical protein
MASFIEALDKEIADIRLDITMRPDPRLQKLNELERLRTLYIDANVVAPRSSTPGADDVEHLRNARSGSAGRKRSPERQAAIEESANYLKNKTEPVKTSELVEMLRYKNVQLPGTDPVSNLSAMLSNSPLFESHGRMGWTLLSHSMEDMLK